MSLRILIAPPELNLNLIQVGATIRLVICKKKKVITLIYFVYFVHMFLYVINLMAKINEYLNHTS